MNLNKIIHKILSFIGCTPIYGITVIGKPHKTSEGWKYDCKKDTTIIRLFYIKIKTIKH